ncbi:MAG: hypothetical protein KatS3mg057_2474 [Herpetosiphonaceae bacterium]|nr:MAG: hypothetical protein KatS3mg057_2474 [Herpetosiphonaceae bacterium]
MDPAPSIELLGVLVCVLIVAFASAAEAALTAITRHRVHALLNEGEPRAKALMELFENPSRLRSTTLILTVAATIAATALVLDLTRDVALSAGQQALALAGLLLLLLVAGISLPKTIAMARPDSIALRLVSPMRVAMVIATPLLLLLRLIFRPVSGDTNTPLVSEEELRLLVNVGEEDGFIEAEEREMIKGIFDFSDTLVREVMVPRIDIVALPANATIGEALETFLKFRHSRIPIYEESIDQIVGVLNIKDVLALLRESRTNEPVTALLRTPFFVPETMKVDDLLRAMQQKRVRMAIIVDEYGGTAGLATIEDLVEEIVGEIQDEYDPGGTDDRRGWRQVSGAFDGPYLDLRGQRPYRPPA